MAYQITQATKKLIKMNERGKPIRAVAGGTSAGKSVGILQVLIDKAMSRKGILISVVSESLPHLKRGVIRDFLSILESSGVFKDNQWNRTDFIYVFPTGSKIEFFGVDEPKKVRGPRRDILFMNEANNCPEESFDQLEVRTREEVWLDWNPTATFWFYESTLKNRSDQVDFITLTYKDNEALDEKTVQSIESRKHNKAWWKVYGLGQLGEVEGRIYKGWKIIDEIPHEARLERRGLDFGYDPDPSVLVDVYYYNGGYIIDELFYQPKMSNKRIADFINALEHPEILLIADGAEKKSIEELHENGLNVMASEKGPHVRTQMIKFIQDQKISLTSQSINLFKDYSNYMNKRDRQGRTLPVPDHKYSHGPDAIRYGLENFKPKEEDLLQNSYSTGNMESLWV